MPDIFDSRKSSKTKPHAVFLKPDNKKIKEESGNFNPPIQKVEPSQTSLLNKKEKPDGYVHNPLAAFCLHPDRINFSLKDPEERVILLLRKHPIINLGWILLAFLMIVAPSFLSLFSFFESLPGRYQLILIIIWYLITSAFIFEEFLKWFFHINIVTDERIIEVDFVNLFYREITDANIDQIQDVTVEVGGGIETFFHFGDVVIQTAAQIPKIDFEAVPNPDKVARILRELRIEEEQEKIEGRVR